MSLSRVVLITLLFFAGVLATGELHAALLQGTVVDAETGEPLEGAVIVVVWYSRILDPLCMDSCYKFHDATEAVSDGRGDFSVDVTTLSPISYFNAEVFKLGYGVRGLWNSRYQPSPPTDPVIRLMKLKSLTDQVRGDSVDFSVCLPDPKDRFYSCVPPDKVTNYMRLHDLQWKIFGDQGR
jgi:hypothetical protein